MVRNSSKQKVNTLDYLADGLSTAGPPGAKKDYLADTKRLFGWRYPQKKRLFGWRKKTIWLTGQSEFSNNIIKLQAIFLSKRF